MTAQQQVREVASAAAVSTLDGSLITDAQLIVISCQSGSHVTYTHSPVRLGGEVMRMEPGHGAVTRRSCWCLVHPQIQTLTVSMIGTCHSIQTNPND